MIHTEILDWNNKKWMTFFHANRNLWTPIYSEWNRLSKEYRLINKLI